MKSLTFSCFICAQRKLDLNGLERTTKSCSKRHTSVAVVEHNRDRPPANCLPWNIHDSFCRTTITFVYIFANWRLSHFMSMLSRTLCKFFRPFFFSSQGFSLFSWISCVWMELYSVEWNISINNKTAKTQNDLRFHNFSLFCTYKPSFFRGFNEEPQSRYNSNIMDDLQLVS